MTAYPALDRAFADARRAVDKEIDEAIDYAVKHERKKLAAFVWWCEACDEPHKTDENGGGYYSADDCNETGRGVVLCGTCCDIWNKRAADIRASEGKR